MSDYTLSYGLFYPETGARAYPFRKWDTLPAAHQEMEQWAGWSEIDAPARRDIFAFLNGASGAIVVVRRLGTALVDDTGIVFPTKNDMLCDNCLFFSPSPHNSYYGRCGNRSNDTAHVTKRGSCDEWSEKT